MPCHWTETENGWRLKLRPNRPLTAQGFAGVIAATSAMLALPLLAFLGTAVLWGLLPFLLGALWLLWTALRRHAAAILSERLDITPDQVRLTHLAPGKPPLQWQAQTYWVRVQIHPQGGRVEHYLTLTGGGRTVEIGAFLAPEERQALYPQLLDRLQRLRAAQPT